MTEMSKELIERARADIEEILSPAINVKAPYAKVMVDKIIERMAAFAQAESSREAEPIEMLRACNPEAAISQAESQSLKPEGEGKR